MAKKTNDSPELLKLARLGALARLKELDAEAAALRKLFPGLRVQPTVVEPEAEPVAAAPGRPKRNRGRMHSPEARRQHSEKMKLYWLRRKGLLPPDEVPVASDDAQAAEPQADQTPVAAPKPRGRKPKRRG